MTYQAYRFRTIHFEDGSTISRLAEPITAISEEAALADIEDAYRQKVIAWEVYNG